MINGKLWNRKLTFRLKLKVDTAEIGPSGFKSKHLLLWNILICSLLNYNLYNLNFQEMPSREFWVNPFLRYCSRNQMVFWSKNKWIFSIKTWLSRLCFFLQYFLNHYWHMTGSQILWIFFNSQRTCFRKKSTP